MHRCAGIWCIDGIVFRSTPYGVANQKTGSAFPKHHINNFFGIEFAEQMAYVGTFAERAGDTRSIKNTQPLMSIQVGQQAPDFTLRDSDKNKVTLSDYRGKNVLLLFYPLAFTGTCTKELCFMRDNLTSYNNMNAQVFGISVDSLYAQDRFKKELNLNFPLLSDFNKEVSTMYDTIYETFSNDMKGVSKRSAFLIDKEGIIRYAEVLENAGEVPNFGAIQKNLEQISKLH